LRNKAHKEAPQSGWLAYEARVVWPDKSIHWVRVEGKVYYDSSSKAVRVLGTLLDITEQKNIKEALEESEQLLRSITSAAPTGLWMADEKGAINYVNQTWLDWTGVPFESNLGDRWLTRVVEEDKQRVKEKFINGLDSGELYECEFRINHADGAVHWCVANGRPQYRKDGTFAGYIGAFVDITVQKQLQRQKDDFIGIASHELKTPVTSIKAYTQVLEKMMLKKGDTREAAMIGRMDAQLNRLTGLIGDLLDVTKINSGKLQFNDHDFDFNAYAKEIIGDLQRTTSKHTIIEDFEDTGIVFGDKDRIGQVIINLITNSIKYSPEADKIIVHIAVNNNEILLCVEDFGIGIAKANLGKVFEQFYRTGIVYFFRNHKALKRPDMGDQRRGERLNFLFRSSVKK
jgi:PAS domain S-box-containing protein